MKTAAVILAAGKGSRMQSDIPKQYLTVSGRPLIYYALRTFQNSFIDEIILVNIKGKKSVIVNFVADGLKAFTFYDRSSKNGEIL